MRHTQITTYFDHRVGNGLAYMRRAGTEAEDVHTLGSLAVLNPGSHSGGPIVKALAELAWEQVTNKSVWRAAQRDWTLALESNSPVA